MIADTAASDDNIVAGYPFSAIHGAEQMRLALLLNAVSPAIGGVLVRGEKGTAKSTAVRALAALLPPVRVVAGCRFSCAPQSPERSCPDGPHDSAELLATQRAARLVELPVGASEDRVAGSLDLQRALTEGVRAFEPGLLAAAHRGMLYVDEVNLLADHLVDVLLDAAAMGRNHVERDAVSVTHPARFVLIGSMNPEEGELRPQLLDRFGLTVQVAASRDPQVRVEVVRRRLAADADPVAFAQIWALEDAQLRARIRESQQRLATVHLGDDALLQIAEVCAAFDVDGMRADIVTARTAVAHTAWQGRDQVTAEDVRVAALLALPHRRRRNPFDEPGLDPDALDEALARAGENNTPEPEPPSGAEPETEPDPGGGGAHSQDGEAMRPPTSQPKPESESESRQCSSAVEPPDNLTASPDASARDDPNGPGDPNDGAGAGDEMATAAPAPIGSIGRARRLESSRQKLGSAGRRAPGQTGRGRTVRALPASSGEGPIHLVATVTAAATQQRHRDRDGSALQLRSTDLRRSQLHSKQANLVLFVVDASGSMAARQRMSDVKAAVMALLTDAYQRRDKVGLITFRDRGAELVLPPTSSASNAAKQLAGLRTGGRTPLAAGLVRALQLIASERVRDPLRRPLVLLITDGRADNAAAVRAGGQLREHDVIVCDCERGPVRLGLARKLADQLGAGYATLHDLTDAPLIELVENWRIA